MSKAWVIIWGVWGLSAMTLEAGRPTSPIYLYQYRTAEGRLIENHLPPALMAKRGVRLIRVRVGVFRGIPAQRLKRIIQSSEIHSLINHWGQHYGVDPKLIQSVIEVESSFIVKAQSPKGAGGLMQLMPQTADRFNVVDVFDPSENIRGGTAYLRWLLDFFNQDLTKTVAAYNAGEGAVERYAGIPPFQETRRYVPEVLKRYRAMTMTKMESTQGLVAQLRDEGATLFRPMLTSSASLDETQPRSMIYQWEDERGRLRLSDVPPVGSVRNLVTYGGD